MISMVDPGTNRDGEKADSPVGVNVGGELLDQVQRHVIASRAVLRFAIEKELISCHLVKQWLTINEVLLVATCLLSRARELVLAGSIGALCHATPISMEGVSSSGAPKVIEHSLLLVHRAGDRRQNAGAKNC